MTRTFRNVIRLVTIARTLARHNAIEALEAVGLPRLLVGALRRIEPPAPSTPLGARLAAAAVALGPSFIKFGQALSTRSDLLGAEMAADLGQLRDRLPPFSTQEAKAVVETELGKSIDDLFATFDDQAAAAVLRSLQLGARYFDTEPQYGHGKSETYLGRALSGVSREEFALSTKVGARSGTNGRDDRVEQ